ncbi:hypothetical protein CTAYLR_009502 [Chrysophaeum taylorii]|uniref:Mannosyltransferase n=1 Tax=Chrysophaeum taylorii TaxID=2483200 RepID=A0AAD7U4I5_9STRA|nr:hypothetical protein CTAYLR_009502 [Chrysophaeum taylorii]
MRWVVLLAIVLHLVACPYNKVEESFNTQAIHDLWMLGPSRLGEFDHLEFPGTVPRTFLGAIVVSATARLVPFFVGGRQARARLALGLWWFGGFWRFAKGARAAFSPETSDALCFITACQFHLPFYATRTLPNSMAMPLILFAYGDFLLGRRARALLFLVFATFALRCDVAAIAIPFGFIWTFFPPRIPFLRAVGVSVLGLVVAVSMSVVVDSFFWRRFAWPEGEVFRFNNPVDNRSARWGVSPAHWYLTSALPRALGTALPLALFFGPFRLVVPAISSIALLSTLPHKELRFVFPALPLLNLAAAAARPRKHLLLLLLLSPNLAATLFVFARAARLNYPGGRALHLLHEIAKSDKTSNRRVHIDVDAAVSGVSRFGELYRPYWTYNKTEHLTDFRDFDYRLAPVHPRRGDLDRDDFYDVLAMVSGFSGLAIDTTFPFLHCRTAPHLLLLRRRRGAKKEEEGY